MFGFLNVNKPSGLTSHDVVADVRRMLPRRTKVGHAGTLDPFAEGVLVVCVGPATRLVDYVQAMPKRYLAEISLGATSTTDDRDGDIQPCAAASEAPSEQDVRREAARFAGVIRQVPPAHSAVHVAGRRAYELARRQEEFQLPGRDVTIHSIEVLEYRYPRLVMDVRCEGGTYIRSLARDIGKVLRVGAYCDRLTRTEVGLFRIQNAQPLMGLEVQRDLLSPLVALEKLPRVTLGPPGIKLISNGMTIWREQLDESLLSGLSADTELAVLDDSGSLAAVAFLDESAIRPRRVFAGQQ